MNKLTAIALPLSNSLEEYADSHQLFTSAAEFFDWSTFKTEVYAQSNLIKQCEEQLIVIHHESSEHFLCLLLACWRAGKTALIPPNTLQETLTTVARYSRAFFGDIQCPPLVDAPHASPPLVDCETGLMLFTSGSSGDAELIARSFSEINAELALFEAHWSSLSQEHQFAASVSHHHLYGLSFQLLWPLVSGRRIYAPRIRYMESLERCCACIPTVLVSSPAQLSALPGSIDANNLKGQLTLLLSAGAPLSDAAAKDAEEKLGLPVSEIYGSTESGAVAWRHQLENPLWTVFDSMQARLDEGLLSLCGPSLPQGTWLQTADRATINEVGQFKLLGRADKIVKVGGKRISLSAIERELEQHRWVSSARVVQLKRRKSRIGAVVVLSHEASGLLIDQGALALKKQLLHSLESSIERVALPRYWRFVPELPQDSQGKTSLNTLSLLFDPAEDCRMADILSQQHEGNGEASLRLRVPPQLKYLQDHFPGNPVLPGVVQVSWAVHHARELFDLQDAIYRMEAVKFQHIAKPFTEFTLKLSFDADRRRVSFSFSNAQHKYSSGRLVFGAKPND